MTLNVVLYGSSCYDNRLKALGIGVHGYVCNPRHQTEGISEIGEPSLYGYLDVPKEGKVTVERILTGQRGYPDYSDSKRAIGALVLQSMLEITLGIEINQVSLLVENQTANYFNKLKMSDGGRARAFWSSTKTSDVPWQHLLHTVDAMTNTGIVINVRGYSQNPDNKGRVLATDLAMDSYRQAAHGFSVNKGVRDGT